MNTENQNTDYEQLIDELKLKDDKRALNTRRLQIPAIVFGIIFLFHVFVFNDFTGNLIQIIKMEFGIIVLTYAMYLEINYQRTRRVNYGESITTNLKKAEKRYRFLNPKLITELFLTSAILFQITLVLCMQYLESVEAILVATPIQMSIMGLLLLRSYIAWKKNYKSTWDKIRELDLK